VLLQFVQEKTDGGQTFSNRRYTSGGCVRGWVFFAVFSVVVWLFSVRRSEIVAGAEH
jgi:hypothetical protein